jgi:SAM-dependent methyltransferase
VIAKDVALSTTVNGLLSCVVCGEGTPEEFLDLGNTALANKFLTKAELSATEAKYPLRVGHCNSCGHVQLTVVVPPSLMFEEYLYVSSASDTLKAHLEDLSQLIVEQYHLGPDDLVIDVGCNDGTLLNGIRRYGVRTLGVDPAQNLAEFTRGKGIDRYIGFFNSRTAKDIVEKWGTASVITATNTFPHIPNLQDFIEGLRVTLKPEGVFVAEMHYLLDMLEQGAFDTIYHEHISYWALRPMKHLFGKNGMHIVHAERLPLHHGQLRVFVQPQNGRRADPSVAEILETERDREIHRPETFRRFAKKTLQIKQDLGEMLSELRSQGKRVVGYGAPAKGNTLLSFLGIGPESLDYIVDRSPLKQGLYTPGAHIPVFAPERLLSDQPDYVLLLAWNFVDEISQQQAEYRSRGGKFIIPVPQVQVI